MNPVVAGSINRPFFREFLRPESVTYVLGRNRHAFSTHRHWSSGSVREATRKATAAPLRACADMVNTRFADVSSGELCCATLRDATVIT